MSPEEVAASEQRKAEGRKPLTAAQRQATYRQRKAAQAAALHAALVAILGARTVDEARKLAWAAVSTDT